MEQRPDYKKGTRRKNYQRPRLDSKGSLKKIVQGGGLGAEDIDNRS